MGGMWAYSCVSRVLKSMLAAWAASEGKGASSRRSNVASWSGCVSMTVEYIQGQLCLALGMM
jgi:hypothetical protein